MANNAAPSESLPPLTKDQIKILEQARQKLVSLTESLSTLQGGLIQSDPLPPWPSVLTQANIVAHQLSAVSVHLAENKDLLGRLSVFPLPDFPGRQPEKENLLGQLLRKKLEPGVEDWVAEGLQEGKSRHLSVADLEEQDELCAYAAKTVRSHVRGRAWGANYTFEEHMAGIRNVRTGLRRRLVDNSLEVANKGGRRPGRTRAGAAVEAKGDKEEEDGEEEDNNDDDDDDDEEGSEDESEGEDEEMEDVDGSQDAELEAPIEPQIPPMSLLDQLSFSTTGVRPSR